MFKKIIFERTMCYGSCPIYKVEIYNDGLVKWNGIGYVSKIGEYEWNLSAKKIDKLSNLIQQFNFQNYEYRTLDGFATDHPNCIITIEYLDGFDKEIDHYLGDQLEEDYLIESEEISLFDFENKIEQIVGTRKYIKEPLNIYHIQYKEERSIKGAYKGHIVVANNEESAFLIIPLSLESKDKSGKLVLKKEDWEIRRVGKDNTGNLFPYVVMSDKR
jgi:hypothetical protein